MQDKHAKINMEKAWNFSGKIQLLQCCWNRRVGHIRRKNSRLSFILEKVFFALRGLSNGSIVIPILALALLDNWHWLDLATCGGNCFILSLEGSGRNEKTSCSLTREFTTEYIVW